MAVFAFIIGSVIGLVAGLVGWLALGASLLTAFGLYLGLSLVIGMALILISMTPAQPSGHAAKV